MGAITSLGACIGGFALGISIHVLVQAITHRATFNPTHIFPQGVEYPGRRLLCLAILILIFGIKTFTLKRTTAKKPKTTLLSTKKTKKKKRKQPDPTESPSPTKEIKKESGIAGIPERVFARPHTRDHSTISARTSRPLEATKDTSEYDAQFERLIRDMKKVVDLGQQIHSSSSDHQRARSSVKEDIEFCLQNIEYLDDNGGGGGGLFQGVERRRNLSAGRGSMSLYRVFR